MRSFSPLLAFVMGPHSFQYQINRGLRRTARVSPGIACEGNHLCRALVDYGDAKKGGGASPPPYRDCAESWSKVARAHRTPRRALARRIVSRSRDGCQFPAPLRLCWAESCYRLAATRRLGIIARA